MPSHSASIRPASRRILRCWESVDWARETDLPRRKQLAAEIQKVALDEVTYVPWGEWDMPTAFRRNVQGILKFTAPLFWNVTIS